MSQITRCPHCQTSFKVVSDQLRLAEGWVRCGHCKQIFDAFEGLVDDEAPPPTPSLLSLPPELTRAPEFAPPMPQAARQTSESAPLSPPASPPAELDGQESGRRPDPAPLREAWRAHVHDFVGVPGTPSARRFGDSVPRPSDTPARQEPVLVPATDGAMDDRSTSEPTLEPMPALPALDIDPAFEVRPDPDPAPVPEPMPEPELEPEPEPEPESESESESTLDSETALESELTSEFVSTSPPRLEPETEPLALQEDAGPSTLWSSAAAPSAGPGDETRDFDFVRAARRGAFWRKPLVRLLLALLLLSLVAALGLQVALRERDVLAAAYPQVRPWLARLCEPLACTLAPPRRMADVVIDASSFVRERAGEPVYVLRMSVKNSAAMDVAMPAFELTLMDARDQPVLRRVFTVADLGAPTQLAARGDWSTSVRLRVLQGSEQVSGYRLLAFYP